MSDLRGGHERLWGAGLGLTLLVMLGIGVLNARYRAAFNDEAWIGSSAHHLAREGVLRTTVLETRGTFLEGAARRSFWVFPLFPALEAAALRLAGPTSSFHLRLVSLAAGLLLVVAIGCWAWRLTNSLLAAILASLLTGCDYTIFASSSTARPEALVAGLGYLGVVWLLSTQPVRIALGALLLMAALLTHPYALILFAIAGVLTILAEPEQRLTRLTALALAGLLAAGLLLLWGSTDWELFRRHLSGNASAGRSLPTSFSVLSREWTERLATAYGLWPLSPAFVKSVPLWLFLGLGGWTLTTPGLRQTPGFSLLRPVLWAATAGWLALALLDSKKQPYYWTAVCPMLALLTALFWHLLAGVKGWRWARVALALVIAGELAVIAGAASSARRKTIAAVEEVNRLLPSARGGGLVFAPAAIALESQYPDWILDDRRLGFVSGREAAVIVLDAEYRLPPSTPDEANFRSALLDRYRPLLKAGEFEILTKR